MRHELPGGDVVTWWDTGIWLLVLGSPHTLQQADGLLPSTGIQQACGAI